MNSYTLESIEEERSIVNKPCNKVFDRGYDIQDLFDYIDNFKDYFVIKINDNRTMLFKGKKKQCYA